MEKFLEPVFAQEMQQFEETGKTAQVAAGKKEEEHTNPTEYLLMLISLATASLGLYVGWRTYSKADKGYREPIASAVPPVYQVLYNKWYVDEAYDYLFTGRRKLGPVRLGVMGAGDAAWAIDAHFVDGTVNGAGWTTRAVATLSTWWDKWIIDGLFVNGIGILTRLASYPVRLVQWGLVQWYAFVMVAGVLGFVLYYVFALR